MKPRRVNSPSKYRWATVRSRLRSGQIGYGDAVKRSNGSHVASVHSATCAPEYPTLVESAHQAAARCASAAMMASRCAAECLLVDRPDQRRRCIERCQDATGMLNAAAALLVRPPEGDRVHLMMAATRAALLAAQECANACAVYEDVDDVCADCLTACRQADSSLHTLLSALSPFAGAPNERESST